MNKDTNSTTVSATLDYFLIDMWKVKDQRVAELPLIGSGPWFMLIFMTIYLVIISRLNNQMKHRPAYFLRPFQIVYYGFMFGIHGVAVPVVLALARSPINTFLCNMNGSVATDLRATMFIYAGLLYLFVKLTTCLDLMILFWIKEHRKVTTALLMETILGPFILYGEMKYYPGGIIYFPIATDCAINTIKYGLSTRSCAGEELKPIENWEHKVHLLKVLQYCVCTLHSLYSMTIENCNCPLGLRYFLLTLHIFLAIVYIFNDTPLNSTTKSSSLSSSSSPSSTLMTNRVTRSQTKSSNGSSSLSTESATTAIRRNTVKAS